MAPLRGKCVQTVIWHKISISLVSHTKVCEYILLQLPAAVTQFSFFFFSCSLQYLTINRDQWQSWCVALHYADRWTDCWQTVQLNACTATVIFTPLTDCRCVLICWRFPGWQPCFIPHFHCTIKGSSVVLDAAVYWLVFVIITVSQTG